jgi:hypothetical protein
VSGFKSRSPIALSCDRAEQSSQPNPVEFADRIELLGCYVAFVHLFLLKFGSFVDNLIDFSGKTL